MLSQMQTRVSEAAWASASPSVLAMVLVRAGSAISGADEGAVADSGRSLTRVGVPPRMLEGAQKRGLSLTRHRVGGRWAGGRGQRRELSSQSRPSGYVPCSEHEFTHLTPRSLVCPRYCIFSQSNSNGKVRCKLFPAGKKSELLNQGVHLNPF